MEPRQQELYSSVLSSEAIDWEDSETFHAGLLDKEPLKEADEDMVSEVDLNNTVTEEEREEMENELTKLEEEITTLKQVLASKEKRHLDLKQKLGITPLSELRQNFSKSWYDMQTSTAYKKTSETLTTAGQRTSAAFSNLGTAITRKFGDMSMFGLQVKFYWVRYCVHRSQIDINDSCFLLASA
ncbi:tumor protein D53 isoform X11 [Chanodichthys erythropterus]|uniref:tumor protein D53 isoform X11 n=1 Tax=Chanodichthys erythropterus TaxID=933992 RepID=UPI00351F6B17